VAGRSGGHNRRRGRRFVDQMKGPGWASSVSCRRVVSLICAGWVPQDGTFESEWAAGLEIERGQLQGNVIAYSRDAGHSQTLAAATKGAMSSGQLWGVSRRVPPVTSTSRPVRGRSRRWRLWSVSCAHRSAPSGRVAAGWRAVPRARAVGDADPNASKIRSGPIRCAVMPGRLDQQPASMTIAGLRDPALVAGCSEEFSVGTNPR
jgi:hypothetical protein